MSAANHLSGAQFHGTDAALQPGDRIQPRSVTGLRQNAATWRDTSEHISTTEHLPLAAHFGRNVYVVHPVGVIGQDPEYATGREHPQAARTYDAHEAVVLRQVSPEAVRMAQQFRALPRERGVAQPRRSRSLFASKPDAGPEMMRRRNQSRRQLEPDRDEHYGYGDEPPRFKPGTAGVG